MPSYIPEERCRSRGGWPRRSASGFRRRTVRVQASGVPYGLLSGDRTGGRSEAQGYPPNFRLTALSVSAPDGPGVGLWMRPGPLDVPSVPLGRGVLQGECQPAGGRQWLDDLVGQVCGYSIGPRPGGRHGRVARAELRAQPGGPYPTRDRPPPAGQDRHHEQPHQPRRGSRVQGRRQRGKPVAHGDGRRGESQVCSVRGLRRWATAIVARWRPSKGTRPRTLPSPTSDSSLRLVAIARTGSSSPATSSSASPSNRFRGRLSV